MQNESESGPSENPYATTSVAAIEASEAGLDDSQAAEIAAFVGPGAKYYVGKWKGLLNGKSGGAGFNLAAFFLSGLWLAYRKMYTFTVILFGVVLVESLIEEIVFVNMLGYPEVPAMFNRLVGFAVAGVCGACGNSWYLTHARSAIAAVKAEGRTPEATLSELRKRGGTSFLAAIGFFSLFVVAMIAAFIALEVLMHGI